MGGMRVKNLPFYYEDISLEEEQRSSSITKEEPMDILSHIKVGIGKKIVLC
jgi:hypothetical protein